MSVSSDHGRSNLSVWESIAAKTGATGNFSQSPMLVFDTEVFKRRCAHFVDLCLDAKSSSQRWTTFTADLTVCEIAEEQSRAAYF